jgi:hypothetical protein
VTDQVLAPLVQYGAVGVLLVVSLLALRVLYNERAAEAAARIADAKDAREVILALQREVLRAVDRLSDLYEQVKDERRGKP